MTDILTASLILSGAAFILTAAIGVVRLPDVLCRSHAVAKALTLGLFLMLLGLWVHLGDSNAGLKISLAIFFQLVTIPLGSHLVGLLALQKNIPRWKERPVDDHRKSTPK